MKNKLISFLSFSFFLTLNGLSQHQECGTEFTEEDRSRILQFHQEMINSGFQLQRSDSDSLVPVQFHIIRYNDGTGGLDSLSVFNELSSINDLYTNANIEFFHCGRINYIDSTDFVDFEKITDETICDANDVDNVINIYFADNVYKNTTNGTVSLCGYAYLSGSKDRVIMDNDCSTNGSTLAHELGHYFSLRHTHYTGIDDELVDGSNCAFAGDLFCDTPADPKLSYSTVNSSCVYTGTAQDANGDYYKPDTANIMSYSRKPCRDHFSNEQYAAMHAYLLSYRNYLECNYPVALFTENKTTICREETITFSDFSTEDPDSWTWYFPGGDPDTSNQQNPAVQYDSAGTYDVTLIVGNNAGKDTVVKQSYITVEDCFAGYSEEKTKTGFTAYPNPFRNELQLILELEQQNVVEVTLFDGIGKQVSTTGYNLPKGLHQLSIKSEDLKGGFYIVKVTAGNEIFYQRIFKLE